MKKIFTIVQLVIFSTFLYSADVASDDASNYSTFTGNQGTGFGNWNLYVTGTTGSAGHFIGDGASAFFGDIDATTKDFAMYGNGGNQYANAERSFSSSLAVGNTFSIKLAIAFRNGNKGIDLRIGSNSVWNFNVSGDNYKVDGSNLGWTYSQTSIFLIEATQVTLTQIYVRVTRGSDVSNTINKEVGGRLDGFKVYIGETDAGNSLNDIYFNTLRIRDTDPVPVELLSFTALSSQRLVKLNWQTATEVNNYGFEILRSAQNDKNNWEKIGFVNGHGNSNSTKNYSFIDKDVLNGTYSYRLKQIDTDGKYEYSPTVEVTMESMPTDFELSQNYPNPFNPSTVIKYSLPTKEFVLLRVFNVLGNEIITLVNEVQEAGNYKVEFNASKVNVSTSGVYFYRLEAGSFIDSRKMTLVK